jgi:hypothetical protein
MKACETAMSEDHNLHYTVRLPLRAEKEVSHMPSIGTPRFLFNLTRDLGHSIWGEQMSYLPMTLETTDNTVTDKIGEHNWAPC